MVTHDQAPEFQGAVSWLNVKRPLTLHTDLRGKIVLLDFWTFCCINCMHVIPDLKKLEEKFGEKLAVIGVHSAKFQNEKDDHSIRQAILRYGIRHPVINDANFSIWRAFEAKGWPTFVLIDPGGNIVLRTSGEGQYDLLEKAIAKLAGEFAGYINQDPLPLALESDRKPSSALSFPGKVLADEETRTLFIADSNHNRILLGDLDGKIKEVIGSGKIGAQDGDFSGASFNHPQGLALYRGSLFVADTENHLIRRVDLEKREVSTVLGTGLQAGDRTGGKKARAQGLNSPWDLVTLGEKIYIAMAGPHQIWEFDPATGAAAAVFGSGRENILDGVGLEAQLAQPSGITTDGERLFFADSEVSAIRSAAPSGKREVKTLFGHGLFDFGDRDGDRAGARLQHPLGVTFAGGALFVADSYNHKIKQIDQVKGVISNVAGSGKVGADDGPFGKSTFSEPSGLSFAAGSLYVADTNNHAIRVVNIAERTVRTLKVLLPEDSGRESGTHVAGAAAFLPNLSVVTLASRVIDKGKPLNVELKLDLESGYHLNLDAPSALSLSYNGRVLKHMPVKEDAVLMTVELPLEDNAGTIRLDSTLYYCNDNTRGVCLIKSFSFIQPLEFVAVDSHSEPRIRFEAPLEPL